MKRLEGVLVLTVLMVVSLVPAGASEKEVVFLGQTYVLAHHEDKVSTRESRYLPAGQTLTDWSQSIDYLLFPRPKDVSRIDPMIEIFRQLLASTCPGTYFHLIRNERDSALVEWTEPDSCGSDGQHGVSRIFFCERGVCLWAVRSTKRPFSVADRWDWADALVEMPVEP